jgi:hypothetical protein
MALNASPINTGTTAANPAFPKAPNSIIRPGIQFLSACERIQRTGPRLSVVKRLGRVNSAGTADVVIGLQIEKYSSYQGQFPALACTRNKSKFREGNPARSCIIYRKGIAHHSPGKGRPAAIL